MSWKQYNQIPLDDLIPYAPVRGFCDDFGDGSGDALCRGACQNVGLVGSGNGYITGWGDGRGCETGGGNKDFTGTGCGYRDLDGDIMY